MQPNPEQTTPPAPPPPEPTALAIPLPPSTATGGTLPPDRRVTIDQLAVLPDSERRTMWINSLVDAEVARQNYAQDRALARDFAMCGQFDEMKNFTPEQAIATAMVKIQLGRSWGFSAADSMRYIYFANGKPSLENEIVASKLQQAGYDWDVEWLEEKIEHKGKPWLKCVGCTLWIKKWNASEQTYKPLVDRKGQQISVAFTEADADHAMIWEKGKQIKLSEKWNFQSWGRDMYYWRTIGRVKKYHAPHVLRGGIMREEAYEMIPTDALPPGDVPIDLQLPSAGTGTETPKVTVRDRVMGQASFLEDPPHPAALDV
jgi:hypothetical protein